MIYLLFFLLLQISLFSDITPYLKPARDKGDVHHMRNIDFIYMINLDRRPEKFERCAEQLYPFSIFPYRFSAVNGWELPSGVLSDVGVTYLPEMKPDIPVTCYAKNGGMYHHRRMLAGKNYVAYKLSKGAIGIVLSHLSVLKDALDSGYETIWVMEDDIHVIQNPHSVSDLIDQLDTQVGKGQWDVLFTDIDTKNSKGNYVPCYGYAERPNFTPPNPERFSEKVVISPEFRKIGSRFGTYSMILRRSGIEKIFQFINAHKIFLPYDMDFYLPENIRIFTVNEDVVSTLTDAFSDNRNPGYKAGRTCCKN